MTRYVAAAFCMISATGCSQPAPPAADTTEAAAAIDNLYAPRAAAAATLSADETPGATARDPGCHPDADICFSPMQLRADRSFSTIPIDSQLSAVRARLTEVIEGNCQQAGYCAWRDSDGVYYHVWEGAPGELVIVGKELHATDFVGRPIPALGIGTARRQAEVLANVRQFLPDITIRCDSERTSGNVGPIECSATLNPGWIQIGFDRDGNLLAVRFDGYHYT
jgi:hypothetical protein